MSSMRSGESKWRSVGQTGLIPRIRGEILRVITEGNLQLGDRLPAERELALALEASRPSVREAIRTLQAEGRLDVRHGQGVFVAEPADQKYLRGSLEEWARDLSELFAMREVLEVPAARWAAIRQDASGILAIRQAYQDLEDALQASTVDYDELQRLDALFHTRIVQAAGNKLLERTQAVIYDLLLTGMSTTLEVPGRIESSRKDHYQIFVAIEAGNAEGAAATVRHHVLGAQEAAEQRLSSQE